MISFYKTYLITINAYINSILAAITMFFIFEGIILFCFLICLIYVFRNKIRSHFLKKDNIQTFLAPRPTIIYYPDAAKSKKNLLTVQESNCDLENNSTENKLVSKEIENKASLPKIPQIIEDKKCLPEVPKEIVSYRPRRTARIRHFEVGKIHIPDERKLNTRIAIPEHDDEIYRQAKMQRIEEMEKRASERNRRYFAQKESEKNSIKA